MKKKIFYSLFLFSAICTRGNAQWTQVGGIFSNSISDMIVYGNKLHLGGNFTAEGSNTAYWHCNWNGSNFQYQTTLIGGIGISEFAIHDGDLWGAGGWNFSGCAMLAHWDSSANSWICSSPFTGSLDAICSYSGTRYVGGGAIDSYGYVAMNPGTGWVQMASGFSDDFSVSVYSINEVNGEIYAGGVFDSAGAVLVNNIAKWNGTSWLALGQGLDGDVRSIVEYNGELIAGGNFTTFGTSYNQIAKWNGSAWASVGGSVASPFNNGIRDMWVYNGLLYVVGDFDEIGGVITSNIAVWNGTNWAAVGSGLTEMGTAVMVYNGTVYAASLDFSFDGRFWRFDGAVGIKEAQKPVTSIRTFPNPAANQLTVSNLPAGSGTVEVEILSLQGKQLLSLHADGKEAEFDISILPAGFYLVSVKQGLEVVQAGRFMKNDSK